MTYFSDPVKLLMMGVREQTDRYSRGALEWKLQFAVHIDCECSIYMLANRERILPALFKAANKQNEDVEDVVCRFIKNLHKRHLEGKSIVR